MLRKIGYGLLCVSALWSTSVLAMNHEFAPGITVEYELPPNDPQVFANYLFWKIKAVCTIHAQDESDVIFVEAINKQGEVNGKKMSKGDTLSVVVHPNDKLVIVADSGAKVKLTNQGEQIIKAVCST